jgi:hypothetical protein
VSLRTESEDRASSSDVLLQQLDRRIAQIERSEQLQTIVNHSQSTILSLRHRVNQLRAHRIGKKRKKLGRLNRITPAVAQFWASLQFPDFVQEFSHSVRAGDLDFDYDQWRDLFTDAWSLKPVDIESIEAAEAAVIASGSPFGLQLAKLSAEHADWPFVVGNLDIPAWLDILSDDPDPAAADVYFVISRGFSILPPELSASFEANDAENYRSADEHCAETDEEIQRLLKAGFIAEFETVRDELGLPADTEPNVLAIGAVVKKNKTRIVIDPSRPTGRSVNEAADPPDTILPNVAMAMAAMSLLGAAWKVDFTDAFLNHVLQRDSVRLSCIRWKGVLYAYRRLGFGFCSGPSQQQSTTLAVVRALTRRLSQSKLACADPPGLNQRYPFIRAPRQGSHQVSALLGFLDDLGGFNGTKASAWFSFVHYLLLCRQLSLPVALKPGKTDPPGDVLLFLGITFDFKRGIIYLDEERVEKLRKELDDADKATDLSVRQLQSLIGVMVFCSLVIRLGKLHYHSLIDALVELGPLPHPKKRVSLSLAVRENIAMWSKLLSLLNARSAVTRFLRPQVPTDAATDASLTGWGWRGMGLYAFDAWPADWKERLGRALPHHPPEAVRIFICECEAWALLFLCRRLLPKCVGCRLVVKVDNLPVVQMVNNFSTRSSACLPIIQEICWLAAVFDVELVVEWIDTHSNVFPDLLSRRYDESFDQEEWSRLFALHAPSPEEVEYWTEQWPPQNPARPELRPHVPVADVRQYSTVWASLTAAELGAILPEYLQ